MSELTATSKMAAMQYARLLVFRSLVELFVGNSYPILLKNKIAHYENMRSPFY